MPAHRMEWDCSNPAQGCFNLKRRLKFAYLDCALPSDRVGFSDVDGVIERKGNILLIEWSVACKQPGTGQRIMFEQLTLWSPAMVIMVCGDAETMTVSQMAVVRDGKVGGWQAATLVDLQAVIRKWWDWAETGLHLPASRK